MRIRLQQLGDYVCVPLPTSISKSLRFAEGVEVDLVVDADRQQLIVRPATGGVMETAKAADFAPAVEEFLQRYAPVLSEMAAL